MPQFLKKISRETILTVVGILLLIVIAAGAFYAIQFLVSRMKTALDQTGIGEQPVSKFNLDGLKALGIIRERPAGGESTGIQLIPTATAPLPEAEEIAGPTATATPSATTSKPRQ